MSKKIAVIGSGYVGLVTGTCFAESGNYVICVDIDEEKIKMLRKGKVPIYEPGLEDLIRRNLREKRLFFTTSLEEGVKKSDIIFLAVGTPSKESGEPDLSYLEQAVRGVAQAMNGEKILVIKSTVPVGTWKKVKEIVSSLTSYPFHLVSNPEFLKEGSAVEDFMKPDRVVIGTESEKAAREMEELYAPFVRTGHPILHMDNTSAEITKYASNAYLASRISFINEIALLCERCGADVNKVRIGMGTDSRIGQRFLFPGLGFGGSCFPKDVRAIVHTAKELGLEFKIGQAALEVNERQRLLFLERIWQRFGSDLRGKTFAVWGLSFKPRTDDIREAPSLTIVKGLLEKGATVQAYDPEAIPNFRREFPEVRYGDLYEVCKGAHALLILTEWKEFYHPDFEELGRHMKEKVIFDGRNIYDGDRLTSLGWEYHCIGVGKFV